MRGEAAERRRQSGRVKRHEGGQQRGRSAEEEMMRLKKIFNSLSGLEDRGQGRKTEEKAKCLEDEAEHATDSMRRATSDGGEESERLRWKITTLEKEKLELTTTHNQELCRLQAELARLRAVAERGEAQREALQYELTVSKRDADRVVELSRDNHKLTEHVAHLQQATQLLQKALDITRQAREEDQHGLQQDVEERDKLVQSVSTENERLHQLLQEHGEALKELERRMVDLQTVNEKQAEESRRQASEMKQLEEREERSRKEKELSDQRLRSLESNLQAEQAARLETKLSCEVNQARVRDLEGALVTERSGQQEALRGLELLRTKFAEVEKAYHLERESRNASERALQCLQTEHKQRMSDMEAERKTVTDLTDGLEEEKKRHAGTRSLLDQAEKRLSASEKAHMKCMKRIRETLQQHCNAGVSSAKVHGKQSCCAETLELLKSILGNYTYRLEDMEKQLGSLLFASERLEEQNQNLQQLGSDRVKQTQEAEQLLADLRQQMTVLQQEKAECSAKRGSLQVELERERAEREGERKKWDAEREEREKECGERVAEAQRMMEHYQSESKTRLSFLYCVYQRLVAGCVLLDQPQSMLGNFTWKELCDVITEQTERLTLDLQKANDKIAHLQGVCEKKSVCVQELQRSQECVLSRLEGSMKRREEAWSLQHTRAVTQLQHQLQLCRSQCDSLRSHASALELRLPSLTSDLTKLQGLLARSRRESTSYQLACALLAGALSHTHRRACELAQQKALMCRRLKEREALEEEVRTLAAALEGEEGDEDEEDKGRRRRMAAARRWRLGFCVVLAVMRWRSLARNAASLFWLDGGAIAVLDGSKASAATLRGQRADGEDGCNRHEAACVQWLRSKRLSTAILSTMADLQGALAHNGSSPRSVTSVARSSLSRLLEHLLDKSDLAPGLTPPTTETDTWRRLRLSQVKPHPTMKALVATLQQHFMLFSQRLHSAEVERRSLRLEVAHLKRAARGERERQREREEACTTVPAERFHSVCVELRQALKREKEAQTLLQQQNTELHSLQLKMRTHSTEETSARHTLSQTLQSLSEAQLEGSKKERALKILGKHLASVQRERKQVEEKLQRAEAELRDANRYKDHLISFMKATERSYKEVRDSLVQSRGSPPAQPLPLLLPEFQLEPNGAESILGAPEMAACQVDGADGEIFVQSLISSFSQLYQTCSSRIDWLEQEVSAHRSHVTALQGELQDSCRRDNLPFVSEGSFPQTSAFAEATTPAPLTPLLSSEREKVNSNPSQLIHACSALNPSQAHTGSSKGEAKEQSTTKVKRLSANALPIIQSSPQINE